MILTSVLIVTRLEREGLTEKDIIDMALHLDVSAMDKEQKSKLSDILKVLQDSLRIDDDNTI